MSTDGDRVVKRQCCPLVLTEVMHNPHTSLNWLRPVGGGGQNPASLAGKFSIKALQQVQVLDQLGPSGILLPSYAASLERLPADGGCAPHREALVMLESAG